MALCLNMRAKIDSDFSQFINKQNKIILFSGRVFHHLKKRQLSLMEPPQSKQINPLKYFKVAFNQYLKIGHLGSLVSPLMWSAAVTVCFENANKASF